MQWNDAELCWITFCRMYVEFGAVECDTQNWWIACVRVCLNLYLCSFSLGVCVLLVLLLHMHECDSKRTWFSLFQYWMSTGTRFIIDWIIFCNHISCVVRCIFARKFICKMFYTHSHPMHVSALLSFSYTIESCWQPCKMQPNHFMVFARNLYIHMCYVHISFWIVNSFHFRGQCGAMCTLVRWHVFICYTKQ